MKSAKFSVRPITDPDELLRVEDVQRKVWARDEHAIAGRNLLKACVTSGGLVAGAYVRAGKTEILSGFSYGYWGKRNGSSVFWSHMLAVLPNARIRGLGAAMKEFQRRYVAKHGGTAIEWTFDPLRQGNAHLNLRKLGATCGEYLVNSYGVMNDGLNWGLDTDRLICRWPVRSGRRMPSPALASVPALLDADSGRGKHPFPKPTVGPLRSRWIRIACPSDLAALKKDSLATARKWRAAQRKAFQAAFARGYRAVDFVAGDSVGWYLLRK